MYSALTSIEDILDPDSMPDPLEYLPTTDEYPAEFLKPNPGRIELFKGFTFVFLDEEQYSNLVTPINAGLGKAVVFDPNGKTVEELVKFASNKGQILLVQRNTDDDDTFCVEASKQYILCKASLMKTRSPTDYTKQSVSTYNASRPNATPETNRAYYDTHINSSNSSTINS